MLEQETKVSQFGADKVMKQIRQHFELTDRDPSAVGKGDLAFQKYILLRYKNWSKGEPLKET